MENFSTDALAEVFGLEGDFPRLSFNSVSTDSRTIKPRQCFFALRGPRYDGHDYVAEAIAKGASCAVVAEKFKGPDTIRPRLIKVKDPLKALGALAAHYRLKHNFKLIGITGSAGKTTTRRMITHILDGRFRVHTAQKNFNNHIGLALTILAARAEDEIIVAELGANRPGEIGYLSCIARPDVAVVTNVGPAHLEGFGDIETITREKLSIASGLRSDGVLIINGDCERLVRYCRENKIAFESFGLSDNCDVRAGKVRYEAVSSSFYIEDGVRVELKLCGRANIENALAAWIVCRRFGISADEFAERMRTFQPVANRLELKRFGKILVIDDCYNASPASMRNAIELLGQLSSKENRRSVFICGQMAELGRRSEQLHRQLGSYVAEYAIDMVITVGPMAAVVAETAKEKLGDRIEIHKFADTTSVCEGLDGLIREDDIVLVKGSRVAMLERCIEQLQWMFAGSIITGIKKS